MALVDGGGRYHKIRGGEINLDGSVVVLVDTFASAERRASFNPTFDAAPTVRVRVTLTAEQVAAVTGLLYPALKVEPGYSGMEDA